MKRKILALGLFSLCCVGMFVSPARAYFGIFGGWCPPWHHRYVTQITCRPYNAFTPICWGNLVCDGCCPSPCGVASGCLPMTLGAPPWCCNYGPPCGAPCMSPPPFMGGGFSPGGGCCASDMQSQGMPMPMPDVRSQPFTPPMPGPMPSGPMAMGYPQMPNGVAQANYYPNYYQPCPGYYPGYPMPAPSGYNPNAGYSYGTPPYYWYGK